MLSDLKSSPKSDSDLDPHNNPDTPESQEESILKSFRSRVMTELSGDLRSEDDNDVFLKKWLVARDYDVDKAFLMFHKHVQWRSRKDTKSLVNWDAPLDLKSSCPYRISDPDQEGRPVLMLPFGSWTPWDFMDTSERRESYLNYVIQMVEKTIQTMGPNSSQQFVLVADSTGFSVRHLNKFKALHANLECVRIFEANYPEFLHSASVIHAPKVFGVLYSILRPLMSRRTQSKLKIFPGDDDSGSENWRAGFKEMGIPQNN